ncbi:MAG: hypothetical protein GEU91_22090 [Rhizobiales bacterium]|nr:hypothetical protein [Hyphomicrobiales bacterium]
MIRLGAFFVAVCMVFITASIGVVADLYFGLSGSEASSLGLAALTAHAARSTLPDRACSILLST